MRLPKYWTSTISEHLARLEALQGMKVRDKLDHSLPKMTPAGSLQLDWTCCGKPTCRCARGFLHGPYVYRRWREGLKQRKAYVPVRELQRVVAEIEAKRALMPKTTEMRRMLVLAYRNVLRIQGWIGSLCLVIERELFGQEPVSEVNGATVGDRIEREMHQLEQTLMPLLDRAHRMLVRSLDRLEARRSKGDPQAQLSIGHAGQVNVASAVRNGGASRLLRKSGFGLLGL